MTRGNLVTGGSNGGTLLTSVVSMDPIYLYFDADEQSLSALHADGARRASGPVRATPAIPFKSVWPTRKAFRMPAQLDFVDNQLNPQTGTIRARAVLQNKDGQFTPGLFARVQLLGSGEYSAILIDDRAVNTDQNQKYVLRARRGQQNRISQGKARPRDRWTCASCARA